MLGLAGDGVCGDGAGGGVDVDAGGDGVDDEALKSVCISGWQPLGPIWSGSLAHRLQQCTTSSCKYLSAVPLHTPHLLKNYHQQVPIPRCPATPSVKQLQAPTTVDHSLPLQVSAVTPMRSKIWTITGDGKDEKDEGWKMEAVTGESNHVFGDRGGSLVVQPVDSTLPNSYCLP